MRFKVIVLLLTCLISQSTDGVFAKSFKEEQMRYPRVRAAVREKDSLIKELFKGCTIQYPPQEIFIRIFKEERTLELLARSGNNDPFTLIRNYEICSLSGKLGPKREEGDLQVPEGYYYIDRFNPSSIFHLSLGINYPNRSDRILGKRESLGSDIFIHGACVTIGCIPITNEKIKELYLICVEAKSNGQDRIPVHIYPRRLDETKFGELQERFRDDKALISFWENLKEGFTIFEQTHRLPTVAVDRKGRYLFSE